MVFTASSQERELVNGRSRMCVIIPSLRLSSYKTGDIVCGLLQCLMIQSWNPQWLLCTDRQELSTAVYYIDSMQQNWRPSWVVLLIFMSGSNLLHGVSHIWYPVFTPAPINGLRKNKLGMWSQDARHFESPKDYKIRHAKNAGSSWLNLWGFVRSVIV